MTTPPPAPGPIVVKIGGVPLEQQALARDLWLALHSLARTHPGGLILLHGGGKSVDKLLDALHMPTQRREGLRITPPEQMDVIAGVLAGTLNKRLVGVLSASRTAHDRRPVGLCLGDADLAPCDPLRRDDFDPGRVGVLSAQRQPSSLLRELLASGYLPVISSIAIDSDGGLLNVNADDAAAGVARIAGASSLVLLTDVPALLDASGEPIPTATSERIENLITTGAISGGMIVKARAAAATARALRIPVTIMTGNDAHALARWAQGHPQGTRIEP